MILIVRTLRDAAKPLLVVTSVVLLTYALFYLIDDPLDNWLSEDADENIPETVFFLILGGLTILALRIASPKPMGTAAGFGWLKADKVTLQMLALTVLLFLFERATIAAGLYGSAVGVRSRIVEESTAIGVFNSIVLAPLVEEVLFRGYLYTALRQCLPFLTTLILSAMAFALFHIENGILFVLFVLPTGLLLGLARERSGSIALPLFIHALMNGVISVIWLLRVWKAS